MYVQVIVGQIFILSVVIVIGILATRFKIITDDLRKGLSRLIINVTLPLLLVTKLGSLKLTSSLMYSSLGLFVFTFLALAILYITGRLSSKANGLSHEHTVIHTLHTMFGNIIFIGFPLLDALFPNGEGILYASIFQLASNSVLWTFGILMIDKRGEKVKVKHLLNINTIAFIVGVLLLSFSVKIPQFVDSSLGGLGRTTIYLSMLYIGSVLYTGNFKRLLFKRRLYAIAINKLILSPVIILIITLIIIKLIGINISDTAIIVLTLQSGMPCMAIVVMLCAEYKLDVEMATENLFFTTVLSVFTLPLLYAVSEYMIGVIL